MKTPQGFVSQSYPSRLVLALDVTEVVMTSIANIYISLYRKPFTDDG